MHFNRLAASGLILIPTSLPVRTQIALYMAATSYKTVWKLCIGGDSIALEAAQGQKGQ